MKRAARRSAFLSFVACGLIGAAACRAEAIQKPALSLSKASAAAEAELEKRGLAQAHAIVSVSLSESPGDAYYVARIEPPIAAQGAVERPAAKSAAQLVFRIDMSGSVTAGAVPAPARPRSAQLS